MIEVTILDIIKKENSLQYELDMAFNAYQNYLNDPNWNINTNKIYEAQWGDATNKLNEFHHSICQVDEF